MEGMLSIILPAYNEEEMIGIVVERLSDLMDTGGIPYEILFVDDGSTDATWDRIQTAVVRNACVTGVRLSRNFGKESAMFAGLEQAVGDCCVILDCDLQHPPEKILEMYKLWTEGYQVVEGIKESRREETAAHQFAANRFYGFISRATGYDMRNSSDFKLLDRKVVNALNALPERAVFFRALSYWMGFKRTSVFFQVGERVSGQSKWSTMSLVRYALTNVVSFSAFPLHIVTYLGAAMLLASLVFGSISLYQKFAGTALSGFTTVILLQLFSSSIIMISLGFIGLYISRIYEESKHRPRYVISEILKREP